MQKIGNQYCHTMQCYSNSASERLKADAHPILTRCLKKLKLLGKFKRIYAGLTGAGLWLFCSLTTYAGTSDDQLSGMLDSVKDNFGKDSTFIKLLYLAEVIVGVYTYHKTKNIPVLLGIVIISLFLNYASMGI
jgi:type IV conjugative transfer system pilin TraA